jgi:hypothetical protein
MQEAGEVGARLECMLIRMRRVSHILSRDFVWDLQKIVLSQCRSKSQHDGCDVEECMI